MRKRFNHKKHSGKQHFHGKNREEKSHSRGYKKYRKNKLEDDGFKRHGDNDGSFEKKKSGNFNTGSPESFRKKHFGSDTGRFKKKYSGGENSRGYKKYRKNKPEDDGFKRHGDNDSSFKKKKSGNFNTDRPGGFKKKHFGSDTDRFRKKYSGGENFKKSRGDDRFAKRYYKTGSEGFKKKKYKTGEFFTKKYGTKKRTVDFRSASTEKKTEEGLVRLNKYIANAGVCSRREADELIRAGVVSVNGKIITEMGYKVQPGDVVNYGGQTLRREKKRYVLLNKPKDYITTLNDPEGRKNVMELVHNACPERIYPVGRLDRSTTGVLLFTNDGELAKRLTHPSYGIKKIYHVMLDQNLKRSDFDAIAAGVELEDGLIKPDAMDYAGENKNEIGIEIHSGRNRVVRRMFEKFNYKVIKLDRVYFAGLTKKDLPRGRWRHLEEKEINILKMTAGK